MKAHFTFDLLIHQKVTIMKTTFIFGICSIIFAMFLGLRLSSQNPVYKEVASNLSPGYSETFPSKIGENTILGIEKINPKLLKHFNKTFYHATNVKWQQLGNKFLATFSRGEITTRSLFYVNGKLIYTINYSTENQLPDAVKNLVKSGYDDYTITTVAQVLEKDREIWVVKLAGRSHYKTVRVEDGEMEEVENFEKSM